MSELPYWSPVEKEGYVGAQTRWVEFGEGDREASVQAGRQAPVSQVAGDVIKSGTQYRTASGGDRI